MGPDGGQVDVPPSGWKVDVSILMCLLAAVDFRALFYHTIPCECHEEEVNDDDDADGGQVEVAPGRYDIMEEGSFKTLNIRNGSNATLNLG